jgi:hypothetical protein
LPIRWTTESASSLEWGIEEARTILAGRRLPKLICNSGLEYWHFVVLAIAEKTTQDLMVRGGTRIQAWRGDQDDGLTILLQKTILSSIALH